MTIEKHLLEKSYILHRRVYRETSIIASCFVEKHGLVEVIAKGARRAKSPLRAIMHPFCPVFLSWQGHPERLKTLTAIESAGPIKLLSGEVLMSALYVNELLMRILPTTDMKTGNLFTLYDHCLEQLVSTEDLRLPLRRFEKALLVEMGFALDFERDAQGQTIQPEAVYGFNIEDGIVKVSHYQGDNPNMGVPGQVIMDLSKDILDKAHLSYARRLLQLVIRYHLGEVSISSHRILKHLREDEKNV